MQSARWSLKLAPDDDKPYNALTIAILPVVSPNSVPSVVCTFSEHGTVIYAFCISDVFTSRSFNAAKVRAILTDSLETTLTYVKLLTWFAFQETSSILIENTMWHFIYWKPIGGVSSSSRILNATFTELNSFCIAFHHRSFPFSLSNVTASSTVLGTLIPNLCVNLWYILLTAAVIHCLFFMT